MNFLFASSFLMAIGLAACLDSTPGQVVDGAVDAASDAADMATPSLVCSDQAPPRQEIATGVIAFALGPCGEVAVWTEHEREPDALEVLAPDRQVIATYTSDDESYHRDVAFSPSGHRLMTFGISSDLGTGGGFAATLPTTNAQLVPELSFGVTHHAAYYFGLNEELVVVTPSDYTGNAMRIVTEGSDPVQADIVSAVSGGLVYMTSPSGQRDDTGHDAAIFFLPLDDRIPRKLLDARRAWLDGSTQRGRDTFLVTGDGQRLVYASECEAYGGGPCATEVRSILDIDDGSEVVAPIHWRRPVVGAGGLVAAVPDAGGLVVYDGLGAPEEFPGLEAVAILQDHVLASRAGTLYAVALGAEPDALVEDFVTVARISPDGRSAAILHTDPGSPARLAIWHDGMLSHVPSTTGVRRVERIDNDGLVVAAEGDQTLIAGADGSVLGRVAGNVHDDVIARAGTALVFQRQRANAELVHFDLRSKADTVLATGHDFTVALDHEGRRIAFSYTPLSATQTVLEAGRL